MEQGFRDAELIPQILETFRNEYIPVDVDATLEQIQNRQLDKVRFNQTTQLIIDAVDKVLFLERSKINNITELHTLIYCGAKTVIELCKKNDIPTYKQTEIPANFPEQKEEQERLFETSPRRFYRLLLAKEPEVEVGKRPNLEEIKQEWGKRWSVTGVSENWANYVEEEIDRVKSVAWKKMAFKLELKDVNKALKQKKNWSPPGIDGIQNFWYKKFKSLRELLVKKINSLIEQPEELPKFFTVGFTELLSKGGDTRDASKYRPITHLPAIYKIMTRCIYQKIFKHYEDNNILAKEQCGGRKNCFGVRKALTIDAVALDQKSLSGMFVDFEKAFDSVQHRWVLGLMRAYKVNEKIVNFIENAMENWKTRLYLAPDILTDSIALERGVFHGDCTSVLFYWTAMNPLSFILNQEEELGLQLALNGKYMTHVFYMDDLRLYSSDKKNLENMYEEVKKFTEAVYMNVNKDKSYDFPAEASDVYLGYIQKPKICSSETIYHKVRKFESKAAALKKTEISSLAKNYVKNQYMFSPIFNSFGILHWDCFKRELLTTDVKPKLHPLVKIYKNSFHNIYLKLFSDLCRMREAYHKEKGLMENIVANDTTTPLKLSHLNHKEFLSELVAAVFNEKKNRRKRKLNSSGQPDTHEPEQQSGSSGTEMLPT